MERTGEDNLSTALRDEVLRHLGFSQPPAADLEGLRAVYSAWCRNIPFDNLNKVIALRTGASGLLPGIRTEEFFESWLADSTGATCWPSANAVHALLRSLDFDAHRVAAHMQNAGVFNHGTVVVRVGNQDWLVDSSLHTEIPIPLGRGGFLHDNAVFFSEIEQETRENEPATYVLWTANSSALSYMHCRVFPDRVPHGYFVERFEASRERSPFNARPYARRNRDGEVLTIVGNVRHVRSAQGLESGELSRDQLVDALRTEFNLSERILNRWIAAGGLHCAFEPSSAPVIPPQELTPPSRR